MGGQRVTQAAEAAAIASGYMTFIVPAQSNTPLFIADRKMIVESVQVRYDTNAGGASTGTLEKVTSTTALGSGTSIATVNLNGTAKTNITGTIVVPVTYGTPSSNIVEAGSTLNFNISSVGTLALIVLTIRYSTVIK